MTKQMSERDFIKVLESKAIEDRRIIATEMLPHWSRGIGEWLVVNPWRVLVPVSAIVYLLLRTTVGSGYRELVLGLFGGF